MVPALDETIKSSFSVTDNQVYNTGAIVEMILSLSILIIPLEVDKNISSLNDT